MPSRRLLVLGASGFLGPHLVGVARGRGWQVCSASRRPEAVPALDGPGGALGAPDELLVWDAEQEDPVALLERARPDALLSAAALARVDACEREPARAQRLNAEVPGELAGLARERGLRLVHLSTDLVFGARPARGERFDEDDPPAPVHAYGRSKAAGEARVLERDPSALVLRLPLLYGSSGGREAGASDAVLAAVARGERAPLFVDEWRTPLEAGNAARAVLELLERGTSGLLHLAGPERLTRFALGLAVLEARGFTPDEAALRLRALRRAELGLEGLRPEDVSLDAARAQGLLSTPLLAPRAALAGSLP